jgi:phage portal protein BeeE
VLADRISTALARRPSGQVEQRFSADSWFSDFLVPSMTQGTGYGFGLNMTTAHMRVTEILATLPSYAAALRRCPPAFAAQIVRSLVLSQARFTFRGRQSSGKPRKMFGTRALAPLETPWPKATTSQLISRMEIHAGLAGNAYVTNRTPGRLRVLRPDWVAIIFGSHQEPEDAATALDGEIIGYAYANGGLSAPGNGSLTGWANRVMTLLPDEVAHWAPLPDPEGAEIGMSWITPAIRDIQMDEAATAHKIQFFRNGATPNLVVKGIPAATKTQFDELVEMMEANHAGLANAYKTLYLTAGADATIVGSNARDADLKALQGASETRISALSRVPASVLGISEGLAGSSLNAGNFGMARRIFADTWIYPTLQDLAASLAPLIQVPSDAELWTDTTDMPILREDAKDAADIEQVKQTTINGYVVNGWTPESAVAAVDAQDITLLKHSGLTSVQLQPPGSASPNAVGTNDAQAAPDPMGPNATPALPPVPEGF